MMPIPMKRIRTKRVIIIIIIIIDALRVIKNAHTSEILAGTFSEHLMLIATSTRDGELRYYKI